jgi:hypothetical protein
MARSGRQGGISTVKTRGREKKISGGMDISPLLAVSQAEEHLVEDR